MPIRKRPLTPLFAAALVFALTAPAQEHDKSAAAASEKAEHAAAHESLPMVQPDSTTDGSVAVEGKTIAYRAIAGMITVGSNDEQDTQLSLDGRYLPGYG